MLLFARLGAHKLDHNFLNSVDHQLTFTFTENTNWMNLFLNEDWDYPENQTHPHSLTFYLSISFYFLLIGYDAVTPHGRIHTLNPTGDLHATPSYT